MRNEHILTIGTIVDCHSGLDGVDALVAEVHGGLLLADRLGVLLGGGEGLADRAGLANKSASAAPRQLETDNTFLTRRSVGLCFLPSKSLATLSRCLCEMTVSTRAIDLRTTLLRGCHGRINWQANTMYTHLGKLGGLSADNLGDTELAELLLEFVKLGKQIRAVLLAEGRCLDLGHTNYVY